MNIVQNVGEMMKSSKISKEQILQTSISYAKTNGIQCLNIRTIANACNVSIGSIYNYFPTKTELIIAVMEEFWSHACTHEDMEDINIQNFFISYPILYKKIYHYLNLFEGNWLHQATFLDNEIKVLGKKVERTYFDSIKQMIHILLDYDETISPDIWTDTFNKESFCEFLFENMMIELNKGHAYPYYLMELLKKILS